MFISGAWSHREATVMARHLTRVGHTEPPCLTDADCTGAGSVNRPNVCVEEVCRPRPLFPFNSVDLAGTLSAFICIVISSGMSARTRMQLIDYEVMVMMEPMTLAGTIIGVSMNKVCPEWIITMLLVALLSKTSHRMMQKGKTIWNQEAVKDRRRQETVLQQWTDVVRAAKMSPAVVACAKQWLAVTNQRRKKEDEADSRLSSTEVALSMANPIDDEDSDFDDDKVSDDEFLLKKAHLMSLNGVVIKPPQVAALEELHEYKRSIPWGDLSVLLVAWIGLFAYSILKGGHGAPSIIGLVCGSMAYWSLTMLAFPFFVSVTSYFGFKILHRHELMQSCGYTLFIVLGMLPYDYAAWYGAVGFVGGIVGQLGLSYLIRRFRKTAFVLFVIAGVIGVSGSVMGVLGVRDILNHGFRGFRSLCYNV
ncbi:hypothetical protein DYB30_001201 [Aphanomyces astaci]|uniref:Uncharacterized protein n=1 Tax=Aphanomyces astaci TaxID=112090 RepID=A0A397DEH8_APHAT|nr:hypothetical protein DYB34_002843 [Aphanomyces astaci]RHY60638.1 hypothetical protein DYB38_000581 [Aphanomyces astaci]RHY74468.1 hypothetical protein DYB30_001201 [Aphanomyces astaci]RHZ16783.1 hypothetical protein DYB26_000567 [Aphanomyces astaci]